MGLAFIVRLSRLFARLEAQFAVWRRDFTDFVRIGGIHAGKQNRHTRHAQGIVLPAGFRSAFNNMRPTESCACKPVLQGLGVFPAVADTQTQCAVKRYGVETFGRQLRRLIFGIGGNRQDDAIGFAAGLALAVRFSTLLLATCDHLPKSPLMRW